ncbi:MAG: endonuclease/exonuclease/phosphatase family protein [Candidatus Hydrogenedentes bacterium]|nr:endonuclease/exonuclease/phosphatase family protein [Candidatus Hydrogenedentota bacterium]
MSRIGTTLTALATPESGLARGIFLRAKILLVVSGLATLLGALGTLHWLLEILSHFVAWHGMLTAAALLQFSLIRRWRWAGAAAIVLALQLMQPLSWYLPTPSTSQQPNLRLLLANVLTSNMDKDRFLALVDAVDPDVICVQEADDAWAEALEALHVRFPVNSIVPRADNFGIAFYSRLPGGMSGVLFQREHDVPALAATVEVAGRTLSILDVHALPPIGKLMADHRNRHLKSIRNWFEEQSGPAVLLGDLNLTMFSPEYRRFVQGMDLRNARQGFGPRGTWPTWVPFARLPLDQCLIRGDIDVTSFATGPDIGSDHLPIIVDLFVPPA